MANPVSSTASTHIPRRRSVRVIVLRVAAYFLAAWATVATLAAGAFPGGLELTLAVAAYTTVPLLVFARWRGWPFYPSAAFRLLVVRPFWYTQLMLPLVAAGGLIGVLLGFVISRCIEIFSGGLLTAEVVSLLGRSPVLIRSFS